MALLRSPGKFGLVVGEKGMKEIDVDRKLLVTLSRAREQIVVLGYEGVIIKNLFGNLEVPVSHLGVYH
jgi:hypothetical protein